MLFIFGLNPMQKKRKYGKSINLVELWNASDIMTFLSTLKEEN